MLERFITNRVLPLVSLCILSLTLGIMFVWLPMYLILEHECLAEGYPYASLSVYLDGFCHNHHEAVSIKEIQS